MSRSREIGEKLRGHVLRGEAERLSQLAADVGDAWEEGDWDWLHTNGYLSRAEAEFMRRNG